MSRLSSPSTLTIACGALTLLYGAASTKAQEQRASVTVEDCLAATQDAMGGDALHQEFESRAGVPTYEFIIGTDDGEYYVGCDGTTGLVGEVDLLVDEKDPRWTAIAKIDRATAIKVATERYKGDVEEVKRLLLSNGGAVYEVDVEVEDADGEFNVHVDAASGKLMLVNIEYWEIGRPAAEDNDG